MYSFCLFVLFYIVYMGFLLLSIVSLMLVSIMLQCNTFVILNKKNRITLNM